MMRVAALLIAVGPVVCGQNAPAQQAFFGRQKAFLHAVDSLQTRKVGGVSIDPVARLQQEVGISEATARALFALVREYNAEADLIDARLRRSILTRRLQVAGEFEVTYSSELDVVNWANLDLNLFLVERMDELLESLEEEEAQKLGSFMADRASALSYFPLRPDEVGLSGRSGGRGWTRSPLGFWREVMKTPLLQSEGDGLFATAFRDAVLPPEEEVYYLEGKVVSVTPKDEDGRRQVLLSMEDEGPAEAALLIDGEAWELKQEPKPGTIVRFSGTAREFTRDPFLILFVPERITGLSVTTTERNVPFTNPGLDR